MKIIKNIIKSALRNSLVLSIAGVIWMTGAVQAQTKGSYYLTRLPHIKTAEDAAAVAPGDMVVMSCPKCKDIWVTVIKPAGKGREESSVAPQHQCPGCETKIVNEGSGKQSKSVIKHVCKQCGSEDAFCCVMKKGAVATKGMEKPEPQK